MPCHYNVSNYGKGKSRQEPRWHAAAAVAPPNCNHIVVTRNIGPAGDLESSSNIQTCKRCMMNEVLTIHIVKLRQGSGKDRQGMAVKAKGLKA